jgi:hypothetical protein
MALTFTNPIVGGTTLLRPAVRSPGYVQGVSGWTINQDGTAEFNDVTIRGGEIIGGTSLLYSSFPPALGNLIGSDSAGGGTDSVGNVYLPGIVAYSAGGTQATTVYGSGIGFWTATGPGGPWTTTGDGINPVSGGGTAVSGTLLEVTCPVYGGLTASVPGTPGTLETWHSLGTAGATGCTLEQARYRMTVEGETEIDIALVAGAGGSTAGTYTWSNTLPAAYRFTGNYSRAYNMGYVDPVSAGVENPAIAVDGAGTGTPGRVRMFLPAFGANTLFTVSQRIPLN